MKMLMLNVSVSSQIRDGLQTIAKSQGESVACLARRALGAFVSTHLTGRRHCATGEGCYMTSAPPPPAAVPAKDMTPTLPSV